LERQNQAIGCDESDCGENVAAAQPAADYLEPGATAQRRIATTDQTASTKPNGQAPCRNP